MLSVPVRTHCSQVLVEWIKGHALHKTLVVRKYGNSTCWKYRENRPIRIAHMYWNLILHFHTFIPPMKDHLSYQTTLWWPRITFECTCKIQMSIWIFILIFQYSEYIIVLPDLQTFFDVPHDSTVINRSWDEALAISRPWDVINVLQVASRTIFIYKLVSIWNIINISQVLKTP